MRGCRRPTPHTTPDHRILFNHTVCASVNPMVEQRFEVDLSREKDPGSHDLERVFCLAISGRSPGFNELRNSDPSCPWHRTLAEAKVRRHAERSTKARESSAPTLNLGAVTQSCRSGNIPQNHPTVQKRMRGRRRARGRGPTGHPGTR